VSGLVSHLRWVEASWIEGTLLGGTIDAPWTDDDPDREFRIAVESPLAQLLAEYRGACARHRDLVASLDLDTPSRGALDWQAEPVTLRWILLHLTEETAAVPRIPLGRDRRRVRASWPLRLAGEAASAHGSGPAHWRPGAGRRRRTGRRWRACRARSGGVREW
jgi:hypothetical protein